MEEDQYSAVDLSHYIGGNPLFRPIPQPPPRRAFNFSLNSHDTLTFHRPSDPAAGGSSSRFIGFETAAPPNGRWARQETLTLLEIRSSLDCKFKEANQKAPLWDQVSRIMYEEHGYQRSGKKCREKFENLYKYYKKTKEGKAGRQDGRHYRFFRQLEALYGSEPSNPAMIAAAHPVGSSYGLFQGKNVMSTASLGFGKEAIQDYSKLISSSSLCLSNYSDADMSSASDSSELGRCCEDSHLIMSWEGKIRNAIDAEMRKLMDRQEIWMEGMMTAIEDKERQWLTREDEWRRQDAARIERERELWARERAWIEARDAALMEALHKLTTKATHMAAAEVCSHNDNGATSDQTMTDSEAAGGGIWPECELTRLFESREEMEAKFQQRRASEGVLWEEIRQDCRVQGEMGQRCEQLHPQQEKKGLGRMQYDQQSHNEA